MIKKTIGRTPARAALALALVMALAAAAWAADGWQDSADTSWYTTTGGTAASPFTLSTPEQLAGLAKLVKDGTTDFSGKHVALAADIDLRDIEWLPIGWFMNSDSNRGFAGTFDGRGHSVTGLRVTRMSQRAGSEMRTECPALFGYLAPAGTIQNLRADGYIADNITQGAAVLVTWNCGTITNCVASGDVTAEKSEQSPPSQARAYAGLVSAVADGGTMRNCVTYGRARALMSNVMRYAGNFIGYASQSAVSKFNNCVGLGSEIYVANADGTDQTLGGGISMGMIGSTAVNTSWLTGGAGQPKSPGTASAATGIHNENEVPVTAVMLPAPRKYASNADVEIALSLYPATSDASKVTTKWTFDEADVTVKSSANGVATVSSTTNGTKHFKVEVGGLNGFAVGETVTLTGALEFAPRATAVTLAQDALTLAPGETAKLTATTTPQTTSDTIEWKSDAPTVATVDASGTVKAISAGKATITATAGAVKAACEVTVKQAQPAPSPSGGGGSGGGCSTGLALVPLAPLAIAALRRRQK